MEFKDFIEWAFPALIAGAVIYGVDLLRQLKNSIDALNVNVGTLVERSAWHEKELEKLDARLSKLEA
jgi:hypothetical protein